MNTRPATSINLPVSKQDQRWQKCFMELQEFKRRYRHCNVTTAMNKPLALWVLQQRLQYKGKGPVLKASRIMKLNSLGFAWKIQVSKQELLEELRRLYVRRGSIPGLTYVKKFGRYSESSYQYHFGGIVKARAAAGIGSGNIKPVKYSENQLIADLHRLAAQAGRTPNYGDVQRHGKYSITTYTTRFGSFTAALRAAGLEAPGIHAKRYSEGQLLEDLKRLATTLGKMPSVREVRKYGQYSLNTYRRRFGSLKGACKKAGITHVPRSVTPN